MEILFDKLSNEFGLTLISSQQDSQIITTMLFFLSTLNNSSLEDVYLFAQGD
jgi:small-conductance mechanosensitive channel